MTDRELMQMALEALTSHRITANERNNILKALRDRLAQPEPEPVGQMCLGCGSTMSYERLKEMYPQAISCCPEREMVNVYTAPPNSEWVGLTDKRILEIWTEQWNLHSKDYAENHIYYFGKAIEAALRNQNT